MVAVLTATAPKRLELPLVIPAVAMDAIAPQCHYMALYLVLIGSNLLR